MTQGGRGIPLTFAAALSHPPQFIDLADTNHRDLGILATVASKEIMQQLASVDVKPLFIERPSSLQYLADAAADGQMARDQFVGQMTAKLPLSFQATAQEVTAFHSLTFDMIRNAHDVGIRVVFLDDKQSQNVMGRAESQEEAVENFFRPIRAKEEGVYGSAYRLSSYCKAALGLIEQSPSQWRALDPTGEALAHIEKCASVPAQQLELPLANAMNQLMAFRYAYDAKIGARIKELSGSDRAAIFYGGGHSVHAGPNFINVLGPRNVRKIAMIGNDESTLPEFPQSAGWWLASIGSASTVAPRAPQPPMNPRVTLSNLASGPT